MESFLCHLKLCIHLSLKRDWVKLKSCSNDLVIVCISWLFWQKYLVLLESPTAALDHPGKRIACNSSTVWKETFLLVHCHFSTCANLLHELNAVQLICFTEVITGAAELFLACLGAKQNQRNPAWLSNPTAGCCEEIHTITALSRTWTGLFIKNKPGSPVTLTNASTFSFAKLLEGCYGVRKE